MKLVFSLIFFLSMNAQACEESTELPHKLQRLVDNGIVTVNYETEEVDCDTKRVKTGMCEVIGESFAEYFNNKRHKFYKSHGAGEGKG